ncbi:MAG TPA: SPOR domain-containing protein, partial [Candidatus Omnitrophota bacterium]|nr:SPOR domain-containing protein [Candidatus Omnitrophota bacterium]
MTNAWRLGRTALTAVALGALAGCAQISDPRGSNEVAHALMNERDSDRAMAALTRGDYPNAERFAIAALRRDPKDTYGLIVAGLVYQGTGRYDLARQYYEVIITNQSPGTMMVPGESGVMMPKSVVDVARANLGVIDKITGRHVPRSAAQSGRPPGASAIGTPPLPSIAPLPMRADADPLPSAPPSSMAGRPTDAETNVAGRFRILKRLLEEGLITPEEYGARRNANIGALMPYSATPPAQGLERPIPRDEEFVERLKALGVALEGRALNPREHAAERTTILDNLLPAAPRKVELPALPPRDMIEAAAAIGRLERMRSAGLLSADEVKKEQDAVERVLDRRLASAQVSGSATGLRHGMPSASDGTAPWGVKLASVKSEDAAKKSWATLQRKFPQQLAGLEPIYKKENVKGKGTRWTVVAGPLAEKDAATTLCKALRLHRQACDPAT